MMTFIAGMIVGAGIMLVAMALCIAAGRADEWEERNRRDEERMESLKESDRAG